MIPSIFNPHFNYDLTRLGNKNDGGYLVEKKSIITTKYLVSFGINDDVSFESDFLKFLDYDFRRIFIKKLTTINGKKLFV